MKLARSVAESGATAVAVVSDYVAVGLNKGLANMGVRVPDDVSILGMGNIDYGKITTPTLSTVDLGIEATASATIQLLEAMMNDDGDLQAPTIAHTIVERESVAELAAARRVDTR